jgi:hypothetical protein
MKERQNVGALPMRNWGRYKYVQRHWKHQWTPVVVPTHGPGFWATAMLSKPILQFRQGW